MQVRTDLAQAPLQFQGEILILHKINFRAVTDTELCLKPLQMSFPYYLPYPFFGAEIILLFPQCLRFQEYEDNYPHRKFATGCRGLGPRWKVVGGLCSQVELDYP